MFFSFDVIMIRLELIYLYVIMYKMMLLTGLTLNNEVKIKKKQNRLQIELFCNNLMSKIA